MFLLRFDIPMDFIEAMESLLTGNIYREDWNILDSYMDSEADIVEMLSKLTDGLGYDTNWVLEWLEGQRELLEEWGNIWIR